MFPYPKSKNRTYSAYHILTLPNAAAREGITKQAKSEVDMGGHKTDVNRDRHRELKS